MTMKLGLIAGLTALWLSCGCATTARPKIISADRELRRVKAGQPFQSAIDGWFVPDALWLELNEALQRELDRGRGLSPVVVE